MAVQKLAPEAKKLCNTCFSRARERGLGCPFLRWDKRQCEKILKISEIEKGIFEKKERGLFTSEADFFYWSKKLEKEISELSLENCFRNGRLPQNMPQVL